jgi:N-acyl-D-amino-acid deacylase
MERNDAAGVEQYDVLIRNGLIYDGSGEAPVAGDVAIAGDRIAQVRAPGNASGRLEIDAQGLAVAPGFINMMCQSSLVFLADGHSQSDIRQGVTLEVLGESFSMGPLNEDQKRELLDRQGNITFDVTWTTLDEYLEHLVRRGVAPNVASFVGTATVRGHVMGYEDRAASDDELQRMCGLVRQSLEEGAVGLSSALLYSPDCFYRPGELAALAQVAAEYDSLYCSHIRSEGDRLLESVDELLAVARETGVRAEIYHLKVAGRDNWSKLPALIEKVEAARAEGVRITADMYPYTAGATGFDAAMPRWALEGGPQGWAARLKDPLTRQRIRQEMVTPSEAWESIYLLCGGAENVLLSGFRSDHLKPLTGKTLAEVAALRGASPEDTIMDLVLEDDSRVEAAFFVMAEENIRREIALPWVSFCSDSESVAPEGVFLKWRPHPRAYGAFARVLSRYARDERIVPVEEAIRRMTSLPAANLKLERRGALKSGYFADVVVFDPASIQDHATYDRPHQYASGVAHVFVNGAQVLRDGEHTGALPGRVVRGPGWRGAST